MNNKLGITNKQELKKIEYELTNIKYKLIDENFTFNEDTVFSINYLEKIHIYLFSDLYDMNYCKIKENISETTKNKINTILEKMRLLANNFDEKEFSKLLYDLWSEQIFYDGNTRTIISFLKVYNYGFMLDINYNFNEMIKEDFFIDKIIDSISSKKSKKF